MAWKRFFVFFSPFLTISFLPFIKVIPAFAIASHRRTPSNLIITCHWVCFFSLRHKRKKFFISFFCKPYSHFLKFTICSKKDIKKCCLRTTTAHSYSIDLRPLIKNHFFTPPCRNLYPSSADYPFVSPFCIFAINNPSGNYRNNQ